MSHSEAGLYIASCVQRARVLLVYLVLGHPNPRNPGFDII